MQSESIPCDAFDDSAKADFYNIRIENFAVALNAAKHFDIGFVCIDSRCGIHSAAH